MLEETRKALGEVERRVGESEQLGRAVDEAHQRINEMSRLAEERAREMENRRGLDSKNSKATSHVGCKRWNAG